MLVKASKPRSSCSVAVRPPVTLSSLFIPLIQGGHDPGIVALLDVYYAQ